MDSNFKIESKRLLAVEGKDECNFFKALLKRMNVEGVQIVDIGGKGKFPSEIRLLNNMDGFGEISTIGFVRDAEMNTAESAFDSVTGVLRKLDLPTPGKPGEITTTGSPRVSIFIMPDNAGKGMLEDLCLRTIAEERSYACVDAYIQCFSEFLPEAKKERFNEPKARVLAYLATRIPVVNSLGLAAQKGFWQLEHESFQDIRDFLKRLYNDSN